jgi:uncharacterized damage-inducible protein DinB
MDILDRLLAHDAWTTRQLLLRCQDLTDAQLDREFDIAHRTVRATFIHIIDNMEIWTDLISAQPQRPSGGPPGKTIPGLLSRLDAVAADLTAVATRIAREGRLDELWLDTLDNPPTKKSYGGAIAHVITHGMHHRAQLLYMLRLLGLKNLPEGDVLSWETHFRRDNPSASC